MTADIRTAAQREAERLMPIIGHDPMDFARSVAHDSFVNGAVWGAARVTPTRDAIAHALNRAGAQTGECAHEPGNDCARCFPLLLRYADTVLALMQGLAEGES